MPSGIEGDYFATCEEVKMMIETRLSEELDEYKEVFLPYVKAEIEKSKNRAELYKTINKTVLQWSIPVILATIATKLGIIHAS